ncbi:MAG: MBL fold metallo-hydrolase [Pseudomonadota bacterium]|nr:MBL fold metallo-hydrolase [Pseudomonadota bacterium]
MNQNDDLPTSHHRAGGFQNTYADIVPKSLAEVLRWKWDAARRGLPKPPQTPTPRVAPDLQWLRANAGAGVAMQPSLTWIGHATAMVQLGGVTVLTDPIFSDRASPLPFVGPKRHVGPGIGLEDLPRIDLVLVSHNHYDHLDGASVDALARQRGGPPTFIVPLGVRKWFVERGILGVVELDWWQTHAAASPQGPTEIMLCPAQHWSGRGIADRMKTLWGGYAVFAPDCHLFFAGDTGYSRDFQDLKARVAHRQRPELGGGFDIALLPIGAYEPRWFMATQHVNAAEAVKIHRDVGAKASLGLHWGTFQLTDEPLDEPPRSLRKEVVEAGLAEGEFFVLAVGETKRLRKRESSEGDVRDEPHVRKRPAKDDLSAENGLL